MTRANCSVDGCATPVNAKGMCAMHYRRAKYGRPLDAPKAERQTTTCQVAGCDRPTRAKNLCGMHYRRMRLYGDPNTVMRSQRAPEPRSCSVDGCKRTHYGEGLCSAHLRRLRNHGSPTAGRGSAELDIPSSSAPCSAAGCEHEAKSSGLCWAHLNQKRYADNPEDWRRWAADRRARERDAYVGESFAPAEILDRDGWRCGLCGKQIPKARMYPDPQSASIDHIVPLSRGGLHTRANVQAAHLGCNLTKSNGGGGEQLRLIG